MKKLFSGVVLAMILTLISLPAYAAHSTIKIDGVVVTTDAAPETKNNRTMVPLRVISENLGATVNWKDSKVTLTNNKMQITLQPNSNTVIKNGKTELLDVKPYLKNNRLFVPIRFIAETFGCQVNYQNSTVTVNTEPLVINNVKVKAIQYEYHMTMGGIVQQIQGNTYNKALYKVFNENKGKVVDAPANYSWQINLDVPGSYYKDGQYNFMSHENKSIQQFDLYSLNGPFSEEELKGYPEVLIHDVTADKWYSSTVKARESINQLIKTATNNGFVKVLSNTVV
ncbi:copper amine oxidase [Lysinibacillus sp. KCTC 33748]|uniref:copper amine oxidase N-terminal domain-containing protein n=1 Tax=unclassified Lysinibacillus TaxID=2636778 RepID=UPI0009A8744B|nr:MULTISPECIES: copper amine oxidase N-terminal domain-containing protein [unclassified Lysinibacillus]OXS67383.1 copper amine oxidase [Lysinibacillus sp. KCTC 33748]SKC15925.1 Copper amine oxidase N-terminal domain-containing protein [Lysinibacillus sp. AC-3]